MKLTINSNQLSDNPANFMRKIGYTYIRDRRTGHESYARRLTGNFYPRFHCYLFKQGNQITFNLHLDQRPTRYEGQTAHAGEYDSPLTQEELDRLQNAINQQISPQDKPEQNSPKKNHETKARKKWWPF